MTAPPAQKLINNRYRLLRQLTRAQGSTLWEAHDDEQMTLVHLRLLDSNLRHEPLVAMRFRREFAIAKRLEHPALIAPKALIDDTQLAIIYDHPGKKTLANLLQQQSTLSPAKAITLITPILNGLQQAHRHGLIHRNISPHHIWLDPNGQTRLGGFGSAQVLDMARLTTHSVAFGISPFTAPELILGGDADPRADLWSIGTILLHAILGDDAHRFPDQPLQVLLQDLINQPIKRAITAALALDPQTRVQSAALLHDILLNDHEHSQPTAPPQSAPCWSCKKPRHPAIKYCIYCGQGPILRQPGDGTRSIIIPKPRKLPQNASPLQRLLSRANIFLRRYHTHLSAHQQALLKERLHMAGLELDEKAATKLPELPIRVASYLTKDDAARLTAFLQRQEVLDDDALDDLKKRREAAFKDGGHIPMIYQHHWGPVFAPYEQQTWSLRGQSWSSPIFFYSALLFAMAFIAFFLGMIVAVYLGEPFGLAGLSNFFLLCTVLFGPFLAAVGGLRLRNSRPVVKKTTTELLSKNQTRRWTLITPTLKDNDERLLHELLRHCLTHIERAPTRTDKKRRLQQTQVFLEELHHEFKILAQTPDQHDWIALQNQVEAHLRADESAHKDALELTAQLMLRQEQAREQSQLARARIFDFIQLLDTGKKAPPSLDSSTATLTAPLDELRALHQSFLEVEDRPRFDDLTPARQELSLPITLPERFDPIRKLASGGQAQIILAHDHLREESVALKILHDHRLHDPESAHMLRQEFKALKAIDHPNVVAAHELLELDETPILILEVCPGVDLKTMIAVGGSLPPHELEPIAIAALKGLSAIHRQGLLHGDIKPANLMIDQNNQVKIIDLGLSQPIYQSAPAPAAQGTPAYAAPELLADKPLDETTDLYALALTLFEAQRGTPQTPDIRHEIPDEPLWQALATCLSQEQIHRPQSADALKVAIRTGKNPLTITNTSLNLFAHHCPQCQAPAIPGLDRCLDCDAQTHRLKAAKPQHGHRVVLLSAGPGRFGFPRFTLSDDQLATLHHTLQSFTDLTLTDDADQILQKPPVAITPALATDSARLVRDELRAQGLRAYLMPAKLSPRFIRLPHWLATTARQLSPLLAFFPLVAGTLLTAFGSFDPSSTKDLAFFLIPTLPPTLIFFFFLLVSAFNDRTAPATRHTHQTHEDDATSPQHHQAPWAARHHQLFHSAPSTRTKALLRELATTAALSRHTLLHQQSAQPLLTQLDLTVDTALSLANDLITTEQTLLDFGDHQNSAPTHQLITQQSTQLLATIEELRTTITHPTNH